MPLNRLLLKYILLQTVMFGYFIFLAECHVTDSVMDSLVEKLRRE